MSNWLLASTITAGISLPCIVALLVMSRTEVDPQLARVDRFLDERIERGEIDVVGFAPRADAKLDKSKRPSQSLANLGNLAANRGEPLHAILQSTTTRLNRDAIVRELGSPEEVRVIKSTDIYSISKERLYYGAIYFEVIMSREHQPGNVLALGPVAIFMDVAEYARERRPVGVLAQLGLAVQE